jgi:anhydro-N-acetylmuramic acid kinase
MLVAGLISGTSVDGIDVAIVDIRGAGFDQRVLPLAHHTIDYPPAVRRAVLSVSNADTHTAKISQLNFLLGELFAEAVFEACRRSQVPPQSLDLIGSHGQTIYHQAVTSEFYGRAVASTLQIAEPAVIADRTGIPVVADFRPADMAAGGQGAPLVPYVDYLLYRDAKLGRVSLNIGGIANVTAIPPGAAPEQVIAFDTGPGNMLIDALVSQFSRGTMGYDRDGRMAASGSVNEQLLGELLESAYLKQPPPKSAGREQFGVEFVSGLLEHGLEPADLVATVTAFTAASVADAMERFVTPRMRVDQMIVSGGGLRNPEIMGHFSKVLPQVEFRESNDFNIDTDAKEAIAFAVLAHETYHGRPANLPSATGARHPVILGKLVRVFR